MKTTLYRHFDAGGALLYVGISKCALGRLEGHRSEAGWYDQIATVTIEWHPDRATAEQAERTAIRDETPLHNRARHGPTVSVLYGKPHLMRVRLGQHDGVPDLANEQAWVAVQSATTSYRMRVAIGRTPKHAVENLASARWESAETWDGVPEAEFEARQAAAKK